MNLSTIKTGNKFIAGWWKEQIQFSDSSTDVPISGRCLQNQSKRFFIKTGLFVERPQGVHYFMLLTMISIWWGREQMRWLANYRGFTISRFLPPPRVPPPVNQLWMIARHKSWIEMSDRKSLFQMMPWKMWKFESVKLIWGHHWWLISEPICP